jgi:membrane-associated phospholipid phosphatase
LGWAGAAQADADPASPAAPASPAVAPSEIKDPAEPTPVRLVPRAETPELVWDPRWRRISAGEMVGAGLLAAAAIPFAIIPPLGSSYNHRSAFDESARDALRLGTRKARDQARDMSDLLLTVSITYPFFVDALTAAYWKRKSRDVAQQMTSMDLEALAVNAFLSSIVSSVVGSERPYGRLCPDDPLSQNLDCYNNGRRRSFFSGHSSISFTSAGLVCSHHMHFKLFGGGAADAIACATSLVAAGTVASLRVMADQHYMTDVLTGSAIGAAVGFGLPWLLHYRGKGSFLPGSDSGRPGAVTWTLAPGPLGGSLIGTF